MAKISSEFDVVCPCCGATQTVDMHLRRVVGHREPEREDKPELDQAQRILAEAAARREALFQQSVDGTSSKRFEEAPQAGSAGADYPTRTRLRPRLVPRRGYAPNPTRALAGTPKPRAAPAGRALSRAELFPRRTLRWTGPGTSTTPETDPLVF